MPPPKRKTPSGSDTNTASKRGKSITGAPTTALSHEGAVPRVPRDQTASRWTPGHDAALFDRAHAAICAIRASKSWPALFDAPSGQEGGGDAGGGPAEPLAVLALHAPPTDDGEPLLACVSRASVSRPYWVDASHPDLDLAHLLVSP